MIKYDNKKYSYIIIQRDIYTFLCTSMLQKREEKGKERMRNKAKDREEREKGGENLWSSWEKQRVALEARSVIRQVGIHIYRVVKSIGVSVSRTGIL